RLRAGWCDSHRGMAIGVAAGGMSAGQLLLIPLASWLTLEWGWGSSVLWIGLGLLAIVLPLAAGFIRNAPEERGVRPYGATGVTLTAAQASAVQKAGTVSVN